MKTTTLMTQESVSVNKHKALKINIRKYQELMLNDGFLKNDKYYETDAMFVTSNIEARRMS